MRCPLCLLLSLLLLSCKGRAPEAPTESSAPSGGSPTPPAVTAPAPEAPAEKPAAPAPAPTEPAAPAPAAAAADAPQPAASSSAVEPWSRDFDTLADDYRCVEKRVVRRADPADKTYPIFKAYEAALMAITSGRQADYVDAFAEQFVASHKKSWVKGEYWHYALKMVAKYTKSEKDPSFVICRTEEREGSTRFYIKSWDPRKSDPPLTVVKEGEGYKIDFFSP
jgi:hypothetical protein